MVEIDERRWPIVRFTFRGLMTPEAFEAYLRASDLILERGEKYAAVVLAEDLRPIAVPLIRRQATWLKENEVRLRAQSVGVALVLRSPMQRGMLRATLWIQPMPQPYLVCASTEEAMAWVLDRLQSEGVEPPADAAA